MSRKANNRGIGNEFLSHSYDRRDTLLFGGGSAAPIDLTSLPKPIRWFAYFVCACVFAGGLILLFKLVT